MTRETDIGCGGMECRPALAAACGCASPDNKGPDGVPPGERHFKDEHLLQQGNGATHSTHDTNRAGEGTFYGPVAPRTR